MAQGNLANCLTEIFPFEGGYVDHPRDPGGATNMGITFAVLKAWRGTAITKQDVKNLTKAEAADIYAKRYWKPLRGDDLPIGPDLVILDFGINSGISRSAKYTQAIVGETQDGQIGPETLAALSRMDRRQFIKTLCARRLSFVQGLRIWETFGKGWSRRIAHMEAKALSWVSTKTELQKDAKAATGTAAGQAGGAVVVGAGGSTEQVQGLAGLPGWMIAALIALIVVPLVIRLVINAQRAAALTAAAKEA